MNKNLIGIAAGAAVSAIILIFLALWPLSNGPETFIPQDNPAVPPPITTEPAPSAAPQTTPPELQPEDLGTDEPSATDSKPAEDIGTGSTEEVETNRGIPKQLEPARPTATEKEHTKSDRETGRIAAAPSPPPPLIGPSDLEEIHSLLLRLKTAYEGKDISTIKQLLVLSEDQEGILKNIFESYKTIRSDIEAVKIMPDRVTSAILITSLDNERGNLVIPGPRWERQSVRITPKNNRWNQATLDPEGFKASQTGPVDIIAPTIIHSLPAYTAKPGEPATISATITDNVKVTQATLRFRAQGERNYESIRMSERPDHIFNAPIPGSMIKANSTSVEYYIEAKDAQGNLSFEGRPTAPMVIAVVPTPSE
ncbi:MAG TPA: hypothetical protein VLY20_11475 [Nitrospiria bacterium]|nr:hypothetical protein [Nitrospiria bacterium]